MQSDLLPRVNALLARVSIPRSFSSTEELADNASSFLVACFEAVFKSTVSSIRRRPTSDQDYAHNAQRVITTFKELLPSRVSIPDTITGASVAAGELPSIVFLVSLLDDASRLLGGGGPVALSDAAKEALESLGHTVGEQAVAASEAEGVKGVASPPKRTQEVDTSNEALLASSLSFTTSTDGGVEISATFASSTTITTTTTTTTTLLQEEVIGEKEAGGAPTTTTTSSITSSAEASAPVLPTQAPPSPSPKRDIWAGTTPNKLKEKAAVRTALLGGSGGGSAPTTTSATSSSSSSSKSSSGLKSPIRPPPVPLHVLHQPPLQLSMTYNRPHPGTLTPLTAPVSPPTKPFYHGGGRKDAAPPPAPPGSDTLEEGGGDGSSVVTSSTTAAADAAAANKDGGASHIAAQIRALDERRAAAVVAMSVRRRMGVISRMAHANEEELKQIELMTKLTVKTREASTRVFEEKALKAASARASVARHERKVIALRARASIENITRNTLSMRIARSSKQQAASAAMLKALAAQARMGAADELKAAASERSTMLLGAQGRLAWLNHTARMMNEAVLEETAKQVEQRAVATRAQREALERALRDLELDQGRLLEKMKDEQAHAEAAFLAQRVEPLTRASEALEGKATALRIAGDTTDTDSDFARVRTLHRMQGKMGEGEVARAESARLLGQAMRRGASEAGRGEAEAAALEQEAVKLGGRR